MCCSPWGHKELHRTEQLNYTYIHIYIYIYIYIYINTIVCTYLQTICSIAYNVSFFGLPR